jgi:hypothetical protein
MNATRLYRIASVLLVLFAALHTYGFLSFKPPTPAGMAVFDAMNNVHFKVGSASFTYGSFYTGFGLFATVYFLFAAYLAWHLGGMARHQPQAIGMLGWVFVLVQIAGIVLAVIYIAPPPAVFSALVAALLGWAAARVQVKSSV